jgi:hypothetical protein
MTRLPTAREIAIIRSSGEPGLRAFAAALLAAGDSVTGGSNGDDPATRMFGFGLRHDAALPWDGRGARSGTITYMDEERVEQYVGGQTWVAYRRSDLGVFLNDVGDQVRIARRGDAAAVELIGPNRLHDSRSAPAREACSGMRVLRSAEFTGDEVGSYAASVAERYGAVVNVSPEAVRLDFRGAAQLTVTPAEISDDDDSPASALMREPVAGAVRVATAVRSNKLEAAVDAERALVLLAAMLSSEGEAVAIDDVGTIFSAEQLYLLGTRNEMRGEAFSFAAAAAQRQAPPRIWFSDRAGICDELTIFSSRPWRADFAAAFLERELKGLVEARESADPIVPPQIKIFGGGERGEPGGLERLASLAYDTVEVDVGFLDVAAAGDDLRARIEARPDVAAMLVRPIANAIVIAFGDSAADAAEPGFALEMRRAETIATALGAAIAKRGESIATDVLGTLYDAEELLTLALRRCGKSASWAARVAAAALQPV